MQQGAKLFALLYVEDLLDALTPLGAKGLDARNHVGFVHDVLVENTVNSRVLLIVQPQLVSQMFHGGAWIAGPIEAVGDFEWLRGALVDAQGNRSRGYTAEKNNEQDPTDLALIEFNMSCRHS